VRLLDLRHDVLGEVAGQLGIGLLRVVAGIEDRSGVQLIPAIPTNTVEEQPQALDVHRVTWRPTTWDVSHARYRSMTARSTSFIRLTHGSLLVRYSENLVTAPTSG
jgi:hypothetical protein